MRMVIATRRTTGKPTPEAEDDQPNKSSMMLRRKPKPRKGIKGIGSTHKACSSAMIGGEIRSDGGTRHAEEQVLLWKNKTMRSGKRMKRSGCKSKWPVWKHRINWGNGRLRTTRE